MRVGIRRQGIRVAIVSGVTALVIAAGGATPTAVGAPGDGGQPADAPTLSLTSLGNDPDVALYGKQGVQTLTIPVPPGLTPAALTAAAELPPEVRAGSILVTQDDRTVSRVELLQTNTASLSIPLTGARIVDNSLTVQLRSRLLPSEGDCLYDLTAPLRLSSAAIAYSGREVTPTTVSEFLPPVLKRMTVYIPRTPSRAESDAAIRLTAAVAARYGAQNTDVDVAPLAGDDLLATKPSEPMERNVVIRERPGAAVTIVGAGIPTLLITGSANELTNQARLLTSDLSALALSSKAVAGPLKSTPQLPPNRTTIRDLGQPGVNATALKPQVSIPVDQTRLGRPVRDVRVHLKGSYTPLPSSVGGQVVVSIGGQTVDRWATDSTGVVDRWVDVPNADLQRYTNLGVAVDLAGDTGECGYFQPVTLTIDGATAIESSAANPPVPEGFQSLPQALMPKVEVGIEDDSFSDTARAALIVEGLQRLGSLPIDTEVVSVDAALSANGPAIVVSADDWDETLALPVSNTSNGQLEVKRIGQRQPETLTLDPGLKFGSLQTVRDRNRTVVVATSNGAAQQVDSLLDWLDSDSRRWSSLEGNAIIVPPTGDPVPVTAEQHSPDVQAESSGGGSVWWIGGLLVLVAGAAGALLLHRRHRRGG